MTVFRRHEKSELIPRTTGESGTIHVGMFTREIVTHTMWVKCYSFGAVSLRRRRPAQWSVDPPGLGPLDRRFGTEHHRSGTRRGVPVSNVSKMM